MAFLTIKEESVKSEGQGNFISTSGVYDVNLRACEIVTTANGAMQANYIMDKTMSYGNTLTNVKGEQIFGMKIIEALGAVLGEEVLSDPEATNVKFKTKTKEMMCIPELTDVDVKVWVQFEYDLWQGEIKERVNVKRFYRASDGASGSEVLSDENFGSQLEKDQKYISEVKYNAGLTADDVTAWKKEQADANKSGGNTTAKPAAGGNTAAFPGMK